MKPHLSTIPTNPTSGHPHPLFIDDVSDFESIPLQLPVNKPSMAPPIKAISTENYYLPLTGQFFKSSKPPPKYFCADMNLISLPSISP